MLLPKLARMPAAEEKRKCKWVAAMRCTVCGTSPCQAHHLLKAPGKGMGSKADGRWLVPLCPAHHAALHADGNEPRFFASHGLDGPVVAMRIQTQWESNSD